MARVGLRGRNAALRRPDSAARCPYHFSLVGKTQTDLLPWSGMGLPFAAAGVFSPAMARSRSSNG